MEVVIGSNITIWNAPSAVKQQIRKDLTFENPEYTKMKRLGKRAWGIDKFIHVWQIDAVTGALTVPRGYWADLQPFIDQARRVEHRRLLLPEVDFGSAIKLRDYQIPCVTSQPQGIICSPARSGKTVISLADIADKRQPALWLTHTSELLDQSTLRAQQNLKNVGRIGQLGANKWDYGDGKLAVGLIQAILAFFEKATPEEKTEFVRRFGYILVDECHHASAETFYRVVSEFPAMFRKGVTATPDRADGLEGLMYSCIGPMIHQVDREKLIAAGVILVPKLEFVYTEFGKNKGFTQGDEKSGKSFDAGDEQMDFAGYMDDLIRDPARNQLIVDKLMEHGGNHCQLAISDRIEHCYLLRDLTEKVTKAAWGQAPRMAILTGKMLVTCEYWWGGEKECLCRGQPPGSKKACMRWGKHSCRGLKEASRPRHERQKLIKDLEEGKLDIVFATQLAREGLDVPKLDRMHIATPKRAAGAVEQEISRPCTPDPNNPNKTAIIIDYRDDLVGMFKAQGYARNKVYKKIGCQVPKKPRERTQEQISHWLSNIPFN
ncbi:MAG: DEAD/DEAH box helicase family protein [Carboxydocellales bacterium]